MENSHLLISAGKSSRLDALRKKAGLLTNNSALDKKLNQQASLVGLNQATKEALLQAIALIDEKLNSLMNAYPAGKKNTFFKLKHGTEVGRVKKMPVKAVFKLLKIDRKQIKHFQMIENLNLNGQSSDAE